MLPGLGELRKGLRLVDDLQTDPPVFTGRTSSNTPSANGGRMDLLLNYLIGGKPDGVPDLSLFQILV